VATYHGRNLKMTLNKQNPSAGGGTIQMIVFLSASRGLDSIEPMNTYLNKTAIIGRFHKRFDIHGFFLMIYFCDKLG